MLFREVVRPALSTARRQSMSAGGSIADQLCALIDSAQTRLAQHPSALVPILLGMDGVADAALYTHLSRLVRGAYSAALTPGIPEAFYRCHSALSSVVASCTKGSMGSKGTRPPSELDGLLDCTLYGQIVLSQAKAPTPAPSLSALPACITATTQYIHRILHPEGGVMILAACPVLVEGVVQRLRETLTHMEPVQEGVIAADAPPLCPLSVSDALMDAGEALAGCVEGIMAAYTVLAEEGMDVPVFPACAASQGAICAHLVRVMSPKGAVGSVVADILGYICSVHSAALTAHRLMPHVRALAAIPVMAVLRVQAGETSPCPLPPSLSLVQELSTMHNQAQTQLRAQAVVASAETCITQVTLGLSATLAKAEQAIASLAQLGSEEAEEWAVNGRTQVSMSGTVIRQWMEGVQHVTGEQRAYSQWVAEK
ncbi:hypothetical protein KIPB_009745 [Kipferlia bialata]|uniref:Uncharacterized protein n=1 Tax=Kipferlia bialata TaxID=797122 RepID=A0A9K3GLS4_9EUKA|nr:hypothetical protein KIPB_009745 [Kipferlia bialata]|eukprot:g9745.t1